MNLIDIIKSLEKINNIIFVQIKEDKIVLYLKEDNIIYGYGYSNYIENDLIENFNLLNNFIVIKSDKNIELFVIKMLGNYDKNKDVIDLWINNLKFNENVEYIIVNKKYIQKISLCSYIDCSFIEINCGYKEGELISFIIKSNDDKPNTTLFDWINYFSDFYKKSLLAK